MEYLFIVLVIIFTVMLYCLFIIVIQLYYYYLINNYLIIIYRQSHKNENSIINYSLKLFQPVQVSSSVEHTPNFFFIINKDILKNVGNQTVAGGYWLPYMKKKIPSNTPSQWGPETVCLQKKGIHTGLDQWWQHFHFNNNNLFETCLTTVIKVWKKSQC